jgi:hypothetical protein
VSIWIALWIVLSLALLGFLAWSVAILLKQKNAWKTFAAAHKLRYKPGRMMQSPEMDGIIEDYKFNFFTSEHTAEDMRGNRKMTAVEINLQSEMPIDGGVASGGMVPLLKGLNLKAELSPKQEGWSKAYIAMASNKAAFELYLTDERMQALTKLMQINHAWVIFVFKNNMMLLRMDTPSPLNSADQLEKLYKLLIKVAKILELKNGEGKLIKAEEARAPLKEAALPIDDAQLKSTSGLQLEDDASE